MQACHARSNYKDCIHRRKTQWFQGLEETGPCQRHLDQDQCLLRLCTPVNSITSVLADPLFSEVAPFVQVGIQSFRSKF